MFTELFGSFTTAGIFVSGYAIGILVAWAAFMLMAESDE